jgi:hypothetical protein
VVSVVVFTSFPVAAQPAMTIAKSNALPDFSHFCINTSKNTQLEEGYRAKERQLAHSATHRFHIRTKIATSRTLQ